MTYLILAALYEELNQGWIWITNLDYKPRSIVRIKSTKSKKKIYCECLQIDDNYINIYNKPSRKEIENNIPTITMNEWYRKRLGITNTKYYYDLEIKPSNCLWGKLCANLQHPQIVVRMATVLALCSVGLGILSLILGLVSICLSMK